jgi:N-acetylglucosamine-6-phosphate deacetylase
MHQRILKGNIVLKDRIVEGGIVRIEEEKISGVFTSKQEIDVSGVEFTDYGEAFITPGFVDLHLHGALEKDVMDCQGESLKQIALHQSRCGVTGFLGSTMSAPIQAVLEAVQVINRTSQIQDQLGMPSELLGVYIEGPFLSKQKKGAQDPSYIRAMEETDVNRLINAVHGLKAVISLAPEISNNQGFIPKLKEKDFVVAIGHSNASYEQALQSFKKGISHATHLFNAMSGFNHREPGVVGAVLDSDGISAELIADGIHVHPAALRLAVARKGTEKLCLITDSLKAVGAGDGIFQLGDMEIDVKGPRATIKESDVLAGSVLTMNQAVKNMHEWAGVSVSQAVNMASLNPAQVLGLEGEIGSIQPGKKAHLAVLDQEFEVIETILHGRSVFRQES